MHEGWAGLCVIGFWGWVLSAIWLILTVFPARGICSVRILGVWGGATVTFFILWIVGMLHA